jgi:Undecaprenyl-phosphate galactose phosphotransferase WbaP
MIKDATIPKANKWELTKTNRHIRQWMTFLLVLTDLASLLLAFLLAIFLCIRLPGGVIEWEEYIELLPLLIVFISIYFWRGLYPGVGLSPVDELRLVSEATSLVFLILLALTVGMEVDPAFSRLVIVTTSPFSQVVIIVTWVFALVLVQVDRWMLRYLARRIYSWGEPVAIIGSVSETEKIAIHLKRNNHLGFRPALLINRYESLDQKVLVSLKETGIQSAILVIPGISNDIQHMVVTERRFGFKRLYLISSLGWMGSLGVVPHDLEGTLALELRQNLLHAGDRLYKRCVDIILSSAGLIFGFPLLALIAIMVALDSPGPIFYRHNRIGKGGQTIRVWKFRTMVANADLVLGDYLDKHPELRLEWEASQKLKNDPRITRVGKLLRQFSLDELPQILNILKGEMSVVGPRPIVTDEVKYYEDVFTLYKQVNPGLTGLWQVSGRSDVDYSDRVHFDEYYIRNWSIWLDIYIILRTIWVVIRRKGAY